VFKNYWCEGVCTPDYKDDGYGNCKRKCPDGWLNFADFCAKPIPRPRRMSPVIWETEGTGCDAGYHVWPYVTISCIADCPARMVEVGLATACQKDNYGQTSVEPHCRPGYENYYAGCRGCGSGLTKYGEVCVEPCPAGYTQCGVACVKVASTCTNEIKSYLTSKLSAIENFVKSKGYNNDFSGIVKTQLSGAKVCPWLLNNI
jgi:hypothetical protein